MVHWYSCMEHLERYLDMDSYFTIGPGVFNDPAVREVARRAPKGRILVETDGLSAVSWAFGREVAGKELAHTLEAMLEEIAAIRGEGVENVRRGAAAAYAELYGTEL